MNSSEILSLQQQIAQQINDGCLIQAFADIRAFAITTNDHSEDAVIDRLDNNYSMVLRYFIDGVNDPERAQIIADIAAEARAAIDRLARRAMMTPAPSLYYITARNIGYRTSGSIASIAHTYNSEVARLASDFDSISDPMRSRSAEGALRDLFNRVWTSHPLSAADAAALQQFCSQAKSNAASTIIGAILLGALEFYDPTRLATLLQIYMNTTDERIAIRALIAFCIAIFRFRRRPMSRALAQTLAAAKDVPTWKSDLKIITMELMRTRDTAKISERMSKELFPALSQLAPEMNDKISQGDFQMESLMEGGNPEWEEMLRRNGIDQKLREMSEIQAEGGDIYMMSFAKLKHFPFFSEVANWFMPFDPDYSEVAQIDNYSGTIAHTLSRMPMLCDSDKYSVMLSFASMPAQARNAAQAAMDGENRQLQDMLSELEKADKSNLRKSIANSYVRDIYRFCNLFRRKIEFFNPFEHNINLLEVETLAQGFDDVETLNVIAEFCIKHGYWSEAETLLKRIDALELPSDRRAQKLGYCIDCQGRYLEAVSHYQEAEMLGGAGNWLLLRLARALRRAAKPSQALEYYRRLLETDDSIANVVETAGAAIEAKCFAEAETLFYKAVYLDENNLEALRGLAWAQFLTHKFEEANTSYSKLLSSTPAPEDFLNAGHVARTLGHSREAIKMYRKYAELKSDTPDALASALTVDRRWLIDAGVDTSADRLIIEAASVFSE